MVIECLFLAFNSTLCLA